jgi:hypothetical protein
VDETDFFFRECLRVIKQYWENFWKRQSDAFRLSLATGVGCVAAAGALVLCRGTAAALGSAQGIALVGGFYFLLALAGARWRRTAPAWHPVPLAIQDRITSAPRADRYRSAEGGWEHN